MTIPVTILDFEHLDDKYEIKELATDSGWNFHVFKNDTRYTKHPSKVSFEVEQDADSSIGNSARTMIAETLKQMIIKGT